MSVLSLLSLVFLHQKQLNCFKTRKAMLSEGTCEGLLLGAFAFAECTPYRQVGPLWLSRQTQDVPSSVCLLWYLFWNIWSLSWSSCETLCMVLVCWRLSLVQLSLLHKIFIATTVKPSLWWFHMRVTGKSHEVFWEASPEFHFIVVWESYEFCECRFLGESLDQEIKF